MFIPDMPNLPPQDVPVMIAQANEAQSVATARVRTFGVCAPSSNRNYSAENGLIQSHPPVNTCWDTKTAPPPASATTTILQPPKHGVLRLLAEADGNTFGEGKFVAADQLYVYLPDSNYVGNDTATIEVDFGDGLKVNVKYFFQAVSGGLGDDWVGDYCSKTGPFWKISSTIDASGNSTITSVEYRSSVGAPRAQQPWISPHWPLL